jgi:hypothetical protein
MNGLNIILNELNEIHAEVSAMLAVPMRIEETVEQRLDRARAEVIARMGGVEQMTQANTMAVESIYASGTLD